MGRETTDEEVQKVYDEFWRPIVEPNGVLDFGQVKRELFDFRMMMEEVPKVYDAVTGGRFSKPLTRAQVIIDAAEAHYQDWFAEDEPDGGMKLNKNRPLLVVEGKPIRHIGSIEIDDITSAFSRIYPIGSKMISYTTLKGFMGEVIASSDCISIKRRPSGRILVCVSKNLLAQ